MNARVSKQASGIPPWFPCHIRTILSMPVANPSESRFRAVQCYDDPTNDCGSGSDT